MFVTPLTYSYIKYDAKYITAVPITISSMSPLGDRHHPAQLTPRAASCALRARTDTLGEGKSCSLTRGIGALERADIRMDSSNAFSNMQIKGLAD